MSTPIATKDTKKDIFCDDKLNRKPVIENMTRFIDSYKGQELVLTINSPWGTGKTFFVEYWNDYLQDKGFKTVFFNAWQSDFADDPIFPMVTAMKEEFGDDPLFEQLEDIGTKIIRNVPTVILKLLLEKVTDSSTACELLEGSTVEITRDFMATKSLYDKYKEKLKGFAKEISKSTQHSLVFFIDELDRCKPTYAIELLERLKHFFYIKNIIFVLSIDKVQLSSIVKAVYGSGIDAQGYLARFFDIEFNLPHDDSIRYQINLINENLGLQNPIWNTDFITNTLISLGLDLRTQNKIVKMLVILSKTVEPSRLKVYSDYAFVLICIKIAASDVYENIKKMNYYGDINKIIQALAATNQIKINDALQSNLGYILYLNLIFIVHDYTKFEKIMKETLDDFNAFKFIPKYDVTSYARNKSFAIPKDKHSYMLSFNEMIKDIDFVNGFKIEQEYL